MDQNYQAQLQTLFDVRWQIADIHPFFHKLFPVLVAGELQWQVYEVDEQRWCYQLAAVLPPAMPVPDGVRAAFPLEGYGQRVVCAVTPEIFEEENAAVTFFHEFVHCQQYDSCEEQLKSTLTVAQKAREEQNVMWEIQYPFPFDHPDFTRLYRQSILAAETSNESLLRDARCQLKEILAPTDFEYMLWQEWKEGLARLLENHIQVRLSLALNEGGNQPPFSRVSFYAGGAAFIEYLTRTDPALIIDLPTLFDRMLTFGD